MTLILETLFTLWTELLFLVSLDVYNRSNEFKPLDYQQQIDLYKKYTELKKSPQITQSQEFNRRISLVIEKAVKQNKSTNDGLNNHHKSTTFEPASNQEEEKTHSGHETTGNNRFDYIFHFLNYEFYLELLK